MPVLNLAIPNLALITRRTAEARMQDYVKFAPRQGRAR
jgi:hypothetical protein